MFVVFLFDKGCVFCIKNCFKLVVGGLVTLVVGWVSWIDIKLVRNLDKRCMFNLMLCKFYIFFNL